MKNTYIKPEIKIVAFSQIDEISVVAKSSIFSLKNTTGISFSSLNN